MNRIQLKKIILIALSSLFFLCSQSSSAEDQSQSPDSDFLTIQVISPTAGLLKRPCTPKLSPNCLVTLDIAQSATPGLIAVFNSPNSKVTAYNIHAIFPSSITDVAQYPLECEAVAPGGNCSILFYPGTTTHSPTEITVKGDNTKSIYFDLEVIRGDK